MEKRNTIRLTLSELWKAYAPNKNSGRVACPIFVYLPQYPHGIEITHIYCGYGSYVLEQNKVIPTKKGFSNNVIYKELFFSRFPQPKIKIAD